MNIKIPYGNSFKNLLINKAQLSSVVYPNEVELGDPDQIILNALQRPLSFESFSEFVSDSEKILIIVNDGTRSTPTAKVIDLIQNKIKDRYVSFLIATGTHRAPSEKELREIFGKYFSRYRKRIHSHDSINDEMVEVGVTRLGTEVSYNKIIFNYDRIIVIGSVEPHYFAGFTGGRKSFLPGVASFKTTEMNHKLALDPDTDILKLRGNPLHEDMDEAVKFLDFKKIFSIMTVLDRENRIYFTAAGDIEKSLNSAAEKSLDIYAVPVKEQADIIIAVVTHPMDINLYQSHKALQHAKFALKPDGIIILVSKCLDGAGNATFFRLLSGAETEDQLLTDAENNYVLGTQTAVKFAELSKQVNLWGVTDIDPEIVRSMFIRPFNTLQEAVDEALIRKQNGKVMVLMNATLTVPQIVK